MNLWGGMILRAGITWGIIAVILAILGAALGPILPEVGGLRLGTYALLFAGVHYSARARSDLLQSALGGGLSGIVAAVLLLLLRFIPLQIQVPMPPGAPVDLIAALVVGFVAGVAGGLGYEVIDR
jgi:hypothetical protein